MRIDEKVLGYVISIHIYGESIEGFIENEFSNLRLVHTHIM